jgi:DNA (cytosine-5)-methyltransferase 1
MELRTLDLFSGCGGLSLGLSMSGDKLGSRFTTAMAVDNWEMACRTFEKNLGLKPKCASVASDGILELLEEAGHIDVVVGGPPCQGFSTSGKRVLDDPRNDLVWSFFKAIEITKPSMFLMENVSGFASFVGGQLLREVKQHARSLGYFVRAGVLQASMHGVPQRRRRFILVGSKQPGFLFPGEEEESLDGIEHDGLDFEQQIDHSKEISFELATSDLPPLSAGESSTIYVGLPANRFQKLMRSDSQDLTLHTAVGHGEKMLSLMSYIPPGKSAFDEGVYSSIPEELRPKTGFKNSYSRLDGSRPAPTITRNFTTPSSANCIHPSQDRALSLREGARAQSFPDRFNFEGSVDEIRLQIGNAVPPFLGKSLGDALLRHFLEA